MEEDLRLLVARKREVEQQKEKVARAAHLVALTSMFSEVVKKGYEEFLELETKAAAEELLLQVCIKGQIHSIRAIVPDSE
jgi:hypothetical protein